MPESPQGHSSFYEHIAVYPDLGIFRRFGPNWAKKVHDQTSEVVECLVKLEDELRACPNLKAKTVLDIPRRKFKQIYLQNVKEYTNIYDAWEAYDKALVRHG
jgi:hypothetical protein